MCAFVQVCMCDWKYFMVKQRVNSDRRQMWSHPSKAARIKNYSNKTPGSGPSSTFLKMTYFRVVLKRSQRKPVNGTGTTPPPPTQTHGVAGRQYLVAQSETKSANASHDLSHPHRLGFTYEVSHSFKHHKAYKT